MSCYFGIAALVIVILSAACNRSAQTEIAVIPKSQSHIFWQTVHAGAAAAGQELGVAVLWNGPASETDFSPQINIVEDFINRQVDGIVLAPNHGEALVPVVEKAMARGIPVTIFDSGIQTEEYVSYVATDNYKGGVLGADRLAQRLGGQGQVALIGVHPGSVSTTQRENGFKETIASSYPDLQLVAFQYGMGDQARSLAVAEDIINANPELDGIFCANESSTVGAVQAVKSLGKQGEIVIVGFDSAPSLIEDMEEGVLDSLVHQDPFKIGYEGVHTIVRKIRGEEPPRRVDTGVYLITKESLNDPEIQRLLNPPLEKYLK
ncbi:MAG: ABC transporter substrate-binding protein [Acidobacteriota bacterium]